MTTIGELKSRAAAHGHVLGAVAVERLPEIKAEFDTIGVDTSPYYDFTPLSDACSVIVVAAYSPARVIELSDGRRVNLPPGYAEDTFEAVAREYLADALIDAPIHLPLKPLAAHSGIGRYGRNDVIYVDSMGSFIRLMAFYTHLDCASEAYAPITRMGTCDTCELCKTVCPTRSLNGELIDSWHCLTAVNESREPFPDWVNDAWHNAIIGCTRCQYVCPVNAPLMQRAETIILDESSTRSLISGDAQIIGITKTPGAVIARNVGVLYAE